MNNDKWFEESEALDAMIAKKGLQARVFDLQARVFFSIQNSKNDILMNLNSKCWAYIFYHLVAFDERIFLPNLTFLKILEKFNFLWIH